MGVRREKVIGLGNKAQAPGSVSGLLGVHGTEHNMRSFRVMYLSPGMFGCTGAAAEETGSWI